MNRHYTDQTTSVRSNQSLFDLKIQIIIGMSPRHEQQMDKQIDIK